MLMNEDAKRKDIIERLEDNVFVEAGAGAGKTTLIVSRIINQLKAGILPGAIVVITFTNAAAEELRSRITKKVRETCKEPGLSEQEYTNLKNAVLYLDLMNISTIHSFCFKLLQERIFDAKLPMEVTLMEAEETNAQLERFFRNWSSKLSGQDWQELDAAGDDKYKALECIKSFFMSICELPEETVITYDASAVTFTADAQVKTLAMEFANLLCDKLGQALGKTGLTMNTISDDNLIKSGKEIKKLFMQPEIDYLQVLHLANAPVKTNAKFLMVTKKELAPGADVAVLDGECRKWAEETHGATILSLLEQKKKSKYTLYLSYALRARTEYRANRSLSKVSNDDLLQKTRTLVCESKSARDYFASKIQCIYVDEFQDTDHIQEEFIWKLAAEAEDDTKLRPGALFVVGDPKQSIYRFRGAEPQVYFSTKAKMENLPNAKVYCLDYNFRSNEKIISWVNEEFAKKDICSGGYREMVHKKQLPANIPEKMLAGIYYYHGINQLTTMDTDIKALATLIYKLVHYDYYICDYDKDFQPYIRNIEYSDFLVLCYSKKEMNVYLDFLNQCGIPVHITGEIPLAGNGALNCYARLFDYLTHPSDYLKKAGARECLQKNGYNQEEILSCLAQEVREMNVSGVANYLLQHPELLLPVDTILTEAQMLSVQTKLQQMVEHVLGAQNNAEENPAQSFWKYSEKIVERELSLEESPNAVRFMNVHKAKGLEGNIVIMTKRKEGFVFRESAYRDGINFYPACVGSYGSTEWSSYHDVNDIFEKAEKEDAQERVRLEYVAATRAKQAFIVMDLVGGNPMFMQYNVMNSSNSETVEKIIDNGQLPQMSVPRLITHTFKDKKAKAQAVPVYHRYKPSDFERTATGTKKADEELSEKGKSSKRPKGNIFGNAMHRSLELLIERWRVDFTKAPEQLGGIISLSVNQALKEDVENLLPEEKEIYRDYLQRMLKSFAFWAYEQKLFTEALEVYTEMPFCFFEEKFLVKEEVLPGWMNGTADLVVHHKSGDYWVLDYKSDRDINRTEEEFVKALEKKYSGQLCQYRFAVSRLCNVPEDKIRLKIISFAGEEEMPVRITELFGETV